MFSDPPWKGWAFFSAPSAADSLCPPSSPSGARKGVRGRRVRQDALVDPHQEHGALAELLERAKRLQREEEWGTSALLINEQILIQDPTCQPARVRKARCLMTLERPEEAVETLRSVLADNSSNGVAASQLEKALRQAGAKERAERLMIEERGNAKERADGLLEASPNTLREELDKAKEEERDLPFQLEGRRLLARHERTGVAACALGAVQRSLGDREDALNTYRWAREQDDSPETNAMADVGMAAVLRDLVRLAQAETLLRGVLRSNPSNPYARLSLAAVLLDRVEELGESRHLVEATQLLDGIWAQGFRDSKVSAGYRRLRRLQGDA